MAELLLHEKIVKENGDIIEMRILRVPKDKAHPEGVRYALVYIRRSKRVIGYDNFEGKGHHKHAEKVEMPYQFISVEKLVEDFRSDIENCAD